MERKEEAKQPSLGFEAFIEEIPVQSILLGILVATNS